MSSSRYPKSNGMAEPAMKTVNMHLKKDDGSGRRQWRPASGYNICAAPHESTYKSVFAVDNQALATKRCQRLELEHKKRRMIANHDSRAKEVRPLKEGQDVTVRPTEDGAWIKGTATEQCDHRLYKV